MVKKKAVAQSINPASADVTIFILLLLLLLLLLRVAFQRAAFPYAFVVVVRSFVRSFVRRAVPTNSPSDGDVLRPLVLVGVVRFGLGGDVAERQLLVAPHLRLHHRHLVQLSGQVEGVHSARRKH